MLDGKRPSEGGEIIAGLPDELALLCLARVSVEWLGPLRGVCTVWRKLLDEGELMRVRKKEDLTRSYLVFVTASVCANDAFQVSIWEPLTKRLFSYPQTSSACGIHKGLFPGEAVCTLNPASIIILGTRMSPTEDFAHQVCHNRSKYGCIFDFIKGKWVKLPPMNSPRHYFALGVVEGTVLVAGGSDDKCRPCKPYAEVLGQQENGSWQPLGWDPKGRRVAKTCTGFVFNERFHVVQAGIPPTVWIYHERVQGWESTGMPWIGSISTQPVAVIDNTLFGVDEDLHVVAYDSPSNSWSRVQDINKEHPGKVSDTFVIGLASKLYLVWISCIDVSILELGNPLRALAGESLSVNKSKILRTELPGLKLVGCATMEY